MRINVKQPIFDYEGNPLLANKTNPDGSVVLDEHNRPVQAPEELRSYVVTALNNVVPGEDQALTTELKARIYALTLKFYPKQGNEAELTHAECALIEERVGKVDGPLVYGRICEILEGDADPA